MSTETQAAARGEAVDADRLSDYLVRNLPGFTPPLSIEQVVGGRSNPTFILSTPAQRYVLRKQPPGELLPSAHQVDREFRVMGALAGSSAPVPKMRLLCQDRSVIGTDFFVMDFIEGRVFRDARLPGMDPAERTAIYDALVEALAKLHSVDWAAAGLGDFGKPGDYIRRQVSRWTRQYHAAQTEPVAAMDSLIAWLPEHVPAGDETTIAHGDFRLENTIFHPTEPRVLAILDWELATLGHPLSDLAYNCMAYRLPSSIRALSGMADLDLASLGIPSEADYVAAYCRFTGRDGIPEWNYFLAFSLFRAAAIMQGVYARSLQHDATGMDGAEVGALVRPVAEIAWDLAGGA